MKPSGLIVRTEVRTTTRAEVGDFKHVIKVIVATDQEVTSIVKKHVKTSVISITK
jgi:hypothetical protein